MKKRLVSLITSLFMVISLVGILPAVTASARTYGDWEYTVISSSTAEITKYNGYDFDVTIPSYINGYKITKIGYGAFQNNDRVETVTMPDTITSIGQCAFYNCVNLSYVKFSNSLKIIESEAFRSCCLKKVKLPNSLTTIEEYAFWNNTYCDYYIPKSVTTIEWNGIEDYETAIYSVKGSYAEQYAKHYGIKFKDVNAPGNVTGFKAAATSAQAVKLTCNKVSGATGYVFYRAVNGKWQRVGVSKTNIFTDTNLKAGTSYRYAVKAYKTVNGKNYYSASYPTLWTSTNPATVSFALTAGSKKAVVKWSKVTGATGYKVYYKTSASGKWVGLKTTNNKTTSYTKSGLAKGKTYYFTVKAYRTVNGKTFNGTFATKSVKVK